MSTHIAILEYPSKSRIYCGPQPERGTFAEDPRKAHCFPTQEAAEDALAALARYFEIRDPSPLKFITQPSSH